MKELSSAYNNLLDNFKENDVVEIPPFLIIKIVKPSTLWIDKKLREIYNVEDRLHDRYKCIIYNFTDMNICSSPFVASLISMNILGYNLAVFCRKNNIQEFERVIKYICGIETILFYSDVKLMIPELLEKFDKEA